VKIAQNSAASAKQTICPVHFSIYFSMAMMIGNKRQKVNSGELTKRERDFIASLPDVQTTLTYLDGSNPEATEKWIDQISEILHRLVEKWTKNSHFLQDLEKIMIYLSDLTQDCHPKRMLILSSAPPFLRSILYLVKSWLSVDDKLSQNAYQFHQCCHLGIFVFLGIINGRALCESFLRVCLTTS
jgi:hypothetical protein